MIKCKVVRWKNTLSTGNIFTEMRLDENPNTLIVGDNGSGKSTILDVISFVFFGKPFRNINKSGLINSVNEKDMLVEIEFENNGKEHKIIRGMKPNIFEIYTNGNLVNQNSSVRDYQEHLEKFILKMNFKSFSQIVVLGSASYIPFMQLRAGERRSIIEDLLDIQIFSIMNVISKQRLQINREEIEKNRYQKKSLEDSRKLIKETIKGIQSQNDTKFAELEQESNELTESNIQIKKDLEKLSNKQKILLEKTTSKDNKKSKHTKLIGLRSKIEQNLERVQTDIGFYEDNDDCPTCHQSIEESFKTETVVSLKKKSEEFIDGLNGIGSTITSLVKTINDIDSIFQKVQEIQTNITKKTITYNHHCETIENNANKLGKMQDTDELLTNNKKRLKEIEKEIVEFDGNMEKLQVQKQYLETAIVLLKDGGIKTKIIKQYLPIINKLINAYLSKMGFFVNFNINENFEETIKSRHRDEFSYQNFSEGEKARIDLAILFTWRAIAKMKNSVSTNLLIMDEVFDGSLDDSGTDELLKIIKEITDGTNTFIISHKTDQLFDKFDKVYRFEKKHNFSTMEVI
jgi:DNA repair exonuclease SbcCD ATPase subunit